METERYVRWKARQELRKQARNSFSHYPEGEIRTAMHVLRDITPTIQEAAYGLTDFVNMHRKTGDEKIVQTWKTLLGTHLLQPFLDDHDFGNRYFSREKVKLVYKGKYWLFFQNLSRLMAGAYPQLLTKFHPKGKQLLKEDFRIGWIPIIREYGLFDMLGENIRDINNLARKNKGVITLQEINDKVGAPFEGPNTYEGERVVVSCPGEHFVRNIFAVNIGLNLGLVHAKKYGEDSRIAIIDELGKPKKTTVMYEEYLLKMSEGI